MLRLPLVAAEPAVGRWRLRLWLLRRHIVHGAAGEGAGRVAGGGEGGGEAAGHGELVLLRLLLHRLVAGQRRVQRRVWRGRRAAHWVLRAAWEAGRVEVRLAGGGGGVV